MSDAADRTARLVAAIRARRSGIVVTVPQLQDSLAAAFAGEEGIRWCADLERRSEDLLRYVHLRTIFFDRKLEAAARRGARQFVLLGAGYDARALRLEALRAPGMVVFELDRADVLERKARICAREGSSWRGVVRPIAVDYAREDFLGRLSASGWSAAEPTFFLWEGNTFYLPRIEVESVLSRVGERAAAGSVLALDYPHSPISAVNPGIGGVIEELGERLPFGIAPEELHAFASSRGFGRIEDVRACTIEEVVFGDRIMAPNCSFWTAEVVRPAAGP